MLARFNSMVATGLSSAANTVVRVLATMKIDNEPYYKEVLQQYPIPGVE